MRTFLEVVRRAKPWIGNGGSVLGELFQKPPLRAAKTHERTACIKHLRLRLFNPIGGCHRGFDRPLPSRTSSTAIRIKAKLGYKKHGAIKATTYSGVQSLRRCERAVRKKLLAINPCSELSSGCREGIVQPTTFTWSEQQRIGISWAAVFAERCSNSSRKPGCGSIRTGSYEEGPSGPAKCSVWIPDSKTSTGVAEVPLLRSPLRHSKGQMASSGEDRFLFPEQPGSERAKEGGKSGVGS